VIDAINNPEFPSLSLLTGLTLPPARLQYHRILETSSATESLHHENPVRYPNVFLLPYFPKPQEMPALLDVRTSQPNMHAVFAVRGESEFLTIPCNQLSLLLGIMRIPEACLTLRNLLRRQPNCDIEAGSLCSPLCPGSRCAGLVCSFLSSGPSGSLSVPRSNTEISPGFVRNIVTWDLKGKALYSFDQCVTLLAERVCPSTGPIFFVDIFARQTPILSRQLLSAPDTTKFLAVILCDGSHFILSVLQLSSSQFWIFEGLNSQPSIYEQKFQDVWRMLLEVLALTRPSLAGGSGTTANSGPPCLIPRPQRVFVQVETSLRAYRRHGTWCCSSDARQPCSTGSPRSSVRPTKRSIVASSSRHEQCCDEHSTSPYGARVDGAPQTAARLPFICIHGCSPTDCHQ